MIDALPLCLNGVFGDTQTLRLSALDRGFLYGDGAFEVLRTYRGVPVALEDHLGRLALTLRALGIALPVPPATLVGECAETLRRGGFDESYLRIAVTRGEVSRPGLDLAGENPTPTRIVVAAPLRPIAAERYRRGAKLRVVRQPRTRAQPGQRDLAQHKTLSYLGNLLALREARAEGFDDALLVGHAEAVFECASGNVFVVQGNTVKSPPCRDGALEGITRQAVLAVARGQGLAVEETPLDLSDVWTADEVFSTASLRQVMPVTWVDDHEVGDGRPGPVTRRLHQGYRAMMGHHESLGY
ncbi:MAG: aminotransferase class IV [Myxococcales bacterium]|nr:aminotransferase class IV [Myxococcales bacterium]